MKNIRRWTITVVACLLITAALATYKVTEIKSAIAFAEAMPEFSETVKATRVKQIDHAPRITVIGEAIAPQRVDLTNELPGRITSVNFSSGALVQKGQVILQLDISEETANLNSARAREKLALSIYNRTRKLRKSTAVSQEKLERSTADLSVVRSEITALQSIIAKKTVRAPFDGLIGIHQFEVGQYLQNNTPITTLVGKDDFIWVDFSVPQFYASLMTGAKIQARLLQNTPTDKDNAVSLEGHIIAQNSIISVQTRSRNYRAKFYPGQHTIMHNAILEVTIPVAQETPRLAIPATAVQNDSLGQYVYLLSSEGNKPGYRSHRKMISTSGHQGDHVIVTSGLAENDLIASAGGFKLHEGGLVYIGGETQQKSATNVLSPAQQDAGGE